MKNFIITFIFLAASLTNSGATTISTQVDRNPVHLDESFKILFEADSSPDDDPDFSPLDKDFEILNQSQSSNISIINGQYNKKIKWTVAVIAKHTGTLTIPAIQFGKDTSIPVRLSVKPADQSNASADADVFMELEIQPETAWVQGQIIVTQRFLSAVNLAAFSDFADLKIKGVDAIIEKLGDNKQFQTKRGKRQYIVIERRLAVFPQQSGFLQISPFSVEARLAGRASSVFDPFQRSGQIKRVSSAGKEIKIRAIADNHNAQHWLPAKEIQISEEWPEIAGDYKAGEPVTRTLTIMADGLTSAQLPEFTSPQINGVKQYPDKPALQNIRKDTGIIGIRQEKIAYIPAHAGQYTLPAIELNWWNSKTGKQEVSRLPAKTIKVLAGDMKAANTATAVPQTETTAPQTPAQSPVQSNYAGFWFGLSFFLAGGWLVTIGLWWVTYRRQTQPASSHNLMSLNQAMKKLNTACLSGNPTACKDALLAWGQLRYPEHIVTSLGQLGKISGEPLQTELSQFEMTLYSPKTEDWHNDKIAQICLQLTNQYTDNKSSTTDTLEPLYK